MGPDPAWLLLLPVLAAGGVLLVCTIQVTRLAGRLDLAERRARRRAVQRAEAARLLRAQRQMQQAQRVAETAVGGGTEAVRLIHHGIAAIPFGILEAIPATRDTTRVVRHAHDLISGAVYGSIKAVNRGIGRGLRAGLHQPAPGESPGRTPGSDGGDGPLQPVEGDPPGRGRSAGSGPAFPTRRRST